MEKVTKYEVFRTTWSAAKNDYVHTTKIFRCEAEAIDWAERHSTRDHILCEVFAKDVVAEDASVNDVKEANGALIYRKHGKVIEDFRGAEAPAEPEHEADAEATAEESSVVAEEAPAVEPIEVGEPVRYYVLLKVAENRKRTKFHFKRRVFFDDQDAIRFARSRLRGGCVSASVYMYDPVVTRYPPEVFESTSAQRDARDILRLLPDTKIFYASRTMAMDLRDVVHDWLTQRRETA